MIEKNQSIRVLYKKNLYMYKILILFLFVGEVFCFYVVDVLVDGVGDLFVEVEVAAEEAGFEFRVDAKQVVHDQDLSVAVFAGADADGGYVEAFGDLFGKEGGDLFQDKTETAGLFEDAGILF